jgi:2-methylisocitrate lyase-like PEP mutase family enzyme
MATIELTPDSATIGPAELRRHCDLLRSLQVPGSPVVLPTAWDVASARSIVAAGFPAVATTSGGVAASLGYEDHEGAPGAEMLAAAARIARAIEVPTTVDAEAGYGLGPDEVVAALAAAGAAGCNLEDSDHAAGTLRDAGAHADWLHRIRTAADARAYPLVLNARIDVFLAALAEGTPQGELVAAALGRARAYHEAGVDCVYPIALRDANAIAAFVADAPCPVNILPLPGGPGVAELAAAGVARISYASLLHRESVKLFEGRLRELAVETAAGGASG